MLNAECIVAGVYDNHDVWHFLSAIGLFFYFMVNCALSKKNDLVDIFFKLSFCLQFLLTVDDNLIDVARADIAVF